MPLNGQFSPPGDKSISHRLILMSLIAKGEMLVHGLSNGEDVLSSLRIFRALGGKAQEELEGLRIFGLNREIKLVEEKDLDCANSGTTMRLIMGILAGTPGTFRLIGDAQLSRRPMERVAEPLRLMGAKVETQLGKPPVTIYGNPLNPIDYQLKDASAQVKGAILLAGLSAPLGPTKVTEIAQTRTHT
jgi:3-phosphoshikimate 1-carboxyvinyltransferase